MSHLSRRVTVTLAAIAATGVMTSPALAASAPTTKAKESKQNKAIRKAQSSASSASKSAKNAGSKANTAGTAAASAGNAAGNAAKAAGAAAADAIRALADAKTANDGVAGILGNVPAILTALTQLKDGLTAAGAGLTTLGDAFQAVEYGALRVYSTPAGSTPDVNNSTAVPGFSANSSDIPDDGNGALVAASLPVQVSATSSPAVDLRVRAAIRSNEADGDASGDPAGQVGAVLYAKCLANCGGGLAAGALACSPVGPPASTDFGTVPGTTTTIGPQTLKNIQAKAPRTGTVAPAFDAPLATSQDGADTKCTLPASGNPGPAVYEVTLSGQFFDFPTAAAPGAKD